MNPKSKICVVCSDVKTPNHSVNGIYKITNTYTKLNAFIIYLGINEEEIVLTYAFKYFHSLRLQNFRNCVNCCH